MSEYLPTYGGMGHNVMLILYLQSCWNVVSKLYSFYCLLLTVFLAFSLDKRDRDLDFLFLLRFSLFFFFLFFFSFGFLVKEEITNLSLSIKVKLL